MPPISVWISGAFLFGFLTELWLKIRSGFRLNYYLGQDHGPGDPGMNISTRPMTARTSPMVKRTFSPATSSPRRISTIPSNSSGIVTTPFFMYRLPVYSPRPSKPCSLHRRVDLRLFRNTHDIPSRVLQALLAPIVLGCCSRRWNGACSYSCAPLLYDLCVYYA